MKLILLLTQIENLVEWDSEKKSRPTFSCHKFANSFQVKLVSAKSEWEKAKELLRTSCLKAGLVFTVRQGKQFEIQITTSGIDETIAILSRIYAFMPQCQLKDWLIQAKDQLEKEQAAPAASCVFTAHALTRAKQREISPRAMQSVVHDGEQLVHRESTTYIDETTQMVQGRDGTIITVLENKRNTRFDLLRESESREQQLLSEASYNDSAMCELAELYLSGTLGHREPEKALTLLLKAAYKKNSHAMCLLAQLYGSGDLGKPDPQKALEWLEQAANFNNKYALAVLGQRYLSQYLSMRKTVGIEKTEKFEIFKTAMEYLQRAANRGSTRAMWQIAQIYENELKNLPKAIEHYTKAAKLGSPSSLIALNAMVSSKKLDSAVFEAILEEVSKLLVRTSSGLAVSIGLMQVQGELGKNPSRGLMMLEQVAEKRHVPEAIKAVAKCYRDGRGCTSDSARSRYWFEKLRSLYDKVASLGNAQAMCDLGRLYLKGVLGKVDEEKAEQAFIRAAASDLPEAHVLLGELYFKKGNVDYTIMHYEKIVALIPEEAIVDHNLACCYVVRGAEGDLVLAIKYFERAIKLVPTASVYCEYGHFLYQQANKIHPCDKDVLQQAVAQLKQAILLSKDGSILGYGKLEQAVIEQYLQTLLEQHEEFTIEPACLAYYLLIKTYYILENYLELKQALEEFENYFASMQSISREPSSLNIELLLLARVKQIVGEYLALTCDSCIQRTTVVSDAASSSAFPATPIVFSEVVKSQQEEHKDIADERVVSSSKQSSGPAAWIVF